MTESVLNKREDLKEIRPLFVGTQECPPSHKFGPYIRDSFLIHFVIRGKGKFFNKNGEQTVAAGQCFIIRPGEVTTYVADGSDPWEYAWIGFVGEGTDIFADDTPVKLCTVELAEKLRKYASEEVRCADIYLSVLYELIFLIKGEGKQSADKLREIRKFIDYNYMKDINVESVAKKFNFERSYLYRIFKNHYGIGIKEYLTKTRMNAAVDFLKQGYSVFDTAAMVGYSDVYNFSRAFKTNVGYPPSKISKDSQNIR